MNQVDLNIYSKDQLTQYLAENHRVKYIFFWGHRPRKENEIDKSCFSQWYDSGFELDTVYYPSAEHYMMAEKARLFNDSATLKKILACQHPGEAKKLGRAVTNYHEARWKQHRFEIVVRANLAKFSQHESLKQFILQSESRILVEASPLDPIWGIGMDEQHPDAANPFKWRGLNLLGFALMKVRQQLANLV